MTEQTAGSPSDTERAPRGPSHLVQRDRSDRVVAIGLRDYWVGDLYHHLLTLQWWAFLLGLAAVYLSLNVIFAVLYLIGDGAIANARPGVFADAFFSAWRQSRQSATGRCRRRRSMGTSS